MKSGFEKLQGTWHIASLEVEGNSMGKGSFSGSQIVITEETFQTIGMGAEYGGTFQTDETANPKTMDMLYTSGPHAGNTSYAIYEISEEEWKLCLAFAGSARPAQFKTTPNSNHALEILTKETAIPQKAEVHSEEANAHVRQEAEFEHSLTLESEEIRAERNLLSGEWKMSSCVINGSPLPGPFVKSGKRVSDGKEMTVTFNGQLFMKARFTVNITSTPKQVDYFISEGALVGKIQKGIYEMDGSNFRTCFTPPEIDRPTEFESVSGDERIFSIWKRRDV